MEKVLYMCKAFPFKLTKRRKILALCVTEPITPQRAH